MTQWDPVCDSPKFFVTQKVNRRPDFPTPSRSLSPSSQPDGPTGWGGGGGREKKGQIVQRKTEETERCQETGNGERLGEMGGGET